MKKSWMRAASIVLAAVVALPVAGCGSEAKNASESKNVSKTHENVVAEVKEEDLLPDADGNLTAGKYTFPLEKTKTIHGLTQFPANTESDPNNRTIFKRIEAKTNVHVDWDSIQSDQWGDKISTVMADFKNLPEFNKELRCSLKRQNFQLFHHKLDTINWHVVEVRKYHVDCKS